MASKTITATAGRPYGHVPGHTYLDADITAKGRTATLVVTWGSAQGYDEEHGREEYTRRGDDLADAIEQVRDAALDEQHGESRRYVEMAASRALAELDD
jgi:hypothetical protein